MTNMELHNLLLNHWHENGPIELRPDFEFESLFQPQECNCWNINNFPFHMGWKYCPKCGKIINIKNIIGEKND